MEDDPGTPEPDDFEDADMKEVTRPETTVTPSNSSWWKHGQRSYWEVLPNGGWIIYTTVFDERKVHINQFELPLSSKRPYDEEEMMEILNEIIERFRAEGYYLIIFTLFLGNGYEPMINAIYEAESMGCIRIRNRSGMAIYADIVRPSGNQREAQEPEDFEDANMKEVVQPPEHEEYELWQIKAAEPGFFDRPTMRWHGTKKIYKYKGNYLVLKNVKISHRGFGQMETLRSWPIYQFVKTQESPDGILLYKGEGDDLEDAKAMIKTGVFQSRTSRYRTTLPETAPELKATVRNLSDDEIRHQDYDASEVKDFPIKRMSVPGSYLDYEEGPHGLWILLLATEKEKRNQGLASLLLRTIRSYAAETGKTVFHGTFTEDGEQYLKPVVDRLWPKEEPNSEL